MKVKLDDLKIGDKIWIGDWEGPIELSVVSFTPAKGYVLPSWELSDGRHLSYGIDVFTTKEEAIDDLIPKLKAQRTLLEKQFHNLVYELKMINSQIHKYEKWVN